MQVAKVILIGLILGDKNYAILSFSVDHPQAQSISKSTVRADMVNFNKYIKYSWLVDGF